MFHDLRRIDLGDWHPREIPETLLRNPALQKQQGHTLPPLEQWCVMLLHNGSLPSALSLFGCASTQLNYNTLDLASTVDSLVTNQVLTNLAKILESPYAIPSQVAISSGTVTTNNSITPSISAPLSVMTTATNTVATTVAAARSSTITSGATSASPNVGLTANAVDQWTQTWAVSPLTDPDQLWRLRSLYQFGAGYLTRSEFLCSYPLIEKSAGAPSPPLGTVTYPTTDGKSVTVTIGDSPNKPSSGKYYVPCGPKGRTVNPDPAFLKEPSCIICAPPKADDGVNVPLYVNPRLRNNWLRWSIRPLDGLFNSSILLGHFGQRILYVESPDDLSAFYEFSLFVLEATTLGAQSATGQSAGKGGSSKSPAVFVAPAGSILLQ